MHIVYTNGHFLFYKNLQYWFVQQKEKFDEII